MPFLFYSVHKYWSMLAWPNALSVCVHDQPLCVCVCVCVCVCARVHAHTREKGRERLCFWFMIGSLLVYL